MDGVARAPASARRGARTGTVRLTTAQALVRYLQAQWSERDGRCQRVIPAMFGIFGHGNVCGLGEAIDEHGSELPFFQPKNEQAMVHTAIGFAKAHNRLATLVCNASVGPGSTNMITSAATATVNRVPVLLLAADTFASRTQGPVMQALEHRSQADLSVNDCFRPVSVFFDRIARPEQLLTALPQAIRTLLDPAETGAVTLSIYQDTQGEAYEYPASFFEPRIWPVVRRPPADEELASAIAAIRASERPLIIAGGGVHYSEANEDLHALAEALGIPVCETSAGKGAMPASELAVGGLGVTGTRAANALARDADLVICVGTRLIDLTTGSHSAFQDDAVRFVSINVAAPDACKLGALPIVADARLALRALAGSLRGWSTPRRWREHAAAARDRWARELDADLAPGAGSRGNDSSGAEPRDNDSSGAEPMSQGQALRVLNEFTGPDDVLVVASGTPHVDVHKLWEPADSARVLMEVGFSCMGHEIPAALGVRLAGQGVDQVYAFIGDGTYLMGASELVTAVQEDLKITVIVSENHGFQSIHSLQRRTTGSSFGLEFRDSRLKGSYLPVDYAANARSFGCAAFEARTLEQFRHALEDARGLSGPCVIVAKVDPLRQLLGSDCWWDVGITEVSERSEMQAIAAEHRQARKRLQRFLG